MAARQTRRAAPWTRRGLVAAAVRIRDVMQNVTGSGRAKRDREESWVEDAWAYRDSVPQVMFASRFLGNSMSRLRLFPGVEDEAGDVIDMETASRPRQVAVEDEGDPTEGTAPALVSPELATAAVEEFDRLMQSPDGLAGMLREAAVNLTIGGEVYLIGYDTDDGETWFMQSKACVTPTDEDGVYRVKHPDTGNDVTVDTRDEGSGFVARIWRRHPRYPWKPDSNIRAILDYCEEVLIINRAMRAIAKSRNSAGLLKLPNELDAAPVDPPPATDDEGEPLPDPVPLEDTDDPPTDELTDFERGVVLSQVTPTEDDGSAASVAPHMLRGPKDALEGVEWIDIGRKIDPQQMARLDWLIRNMAQGVDLPPEILTGLADSNHWTGWLIEDTTYKAHVEPLALLLAAGLATAFLRPALRDRGFAEVEVRRVVIGVDPSDLVVRPNRFADAMSAFGVDALSWEAIRRYGGFSEADAPGMEELVVRYVFQRGIGGMGLTRDLFDLLGVDVPNAAEAAEAEAAAGAGGQAPSSGGDDAPEDGGDPTPGSDEDGPSGGDGSQAGASRDARVHRAFAAVVAAGNAQSDLGPRLASIDSRLRERLQAAASAALAAALDRAGKRLRAAVQGDPDLAARTKGVDNAEVGAIVGDGVVDAAELLSPDDFDGLRQMWDAWTGQATDQALAAVRADATTRGVDRATIDPAETEATAGADGDRDAGWALLLAGLLTLGRARIFTPDGTPDDGEFDPNLSVPPGLVREALTTAGGGLPAVEAGASSGGPASGDRMMRYVRRLGAVVVGWRWETGMPARPFHPHHALAGVVFTRWDDPRLAGAGWPADGGFYRPGDHKGCQCDAVPLLVFQPEGGGAAPVPALVPRS